MNYRSDMAFAVEADRGDGLAPFRERFHLPLRANREPQIYLCGNSLGLQPRNAREAIEQELRDWEMLGVKGHFSARNPWMPYHEHLTDMTARLVGAKPVEVVHMNTLTTNLHLMMVSFYRPTARRFKLLIEKPAFPSDRYAAESQVRFHGFDPAEALIEIGPREGEAVIRDEDIDAVIEREGERLALILLPGVQYYSGQAFDMERITELGHRVGARVGFDLAHAAGNLELALHEWGPDFACWCSYKYLNGGPGAIAGCFVHERHAENDSLPRFAGWWGHDKHTRFRMGPEFHPMPGAEGWQLSNPPILALAPVLASLKHFDEAGMRALREKAERLTGYFEFLLRQRLADHVDIITPSEPERRGCQLSLRIRGAEGAGRTVFRALEDNGVVCDWREPDVIRAAPVPLYNTFMEVHRFVEIMEQAVA